MNETTLTPENINVLVEDIVLNLNTHCVCVREKAVKTEEFTGNSDALREGDRKVLILLSNFAPVGNLHAYAERISIQ